MGEVRRNERTQEIPDKRDRHLRKDGRQEMRETTFVRLVLLPELRDTAVTKTDCDLCPSQTGHREGWSRSRLTEPHCTPPEVVGSSLLCSFL